MGALESTTRLSLLRRLKDEPQDEDAWAEFVAIYQPTIHLWCVNYGLQNVDADDVAQNVLLKIAKHMRRFERREGGRFRSWLRAVVKNAWIDFAQGKRIQGSGDASIQSLLSSVEAADELECRVEKEYDHQLLEEAIKIVRRRVKPHIWQAFQMIGLDGASAEETARQLAITVANVYVCKSRVQKIFTAEVSRLETE
jgi:RNA polymerase sigma-70 factor (ECF subfamily)